MMRALVVLAYGIFYMPSTTETSVFTPVSRDINCNLFFEGSFKRERVGS